MNVSFVLLRRYVILFMPLLFLRSKYTHGKTLTTTTHTHTQDDHLKQ